MFVSILSILSSLDLISSSGMKEATFHLESSNLVYSSVGYSSLSQVNLSPQRANSNSIIFHVVTENTNDNQIDTLMTDDKVIVKSILAEITN